MKSPPMTKKIELPGFSWENIGEMFFQYKTSRLFSQHLLILADNEMKFHLIHQEKRNWKYHQVPLKYFKVLRFHVFYFRILFMKYASKECNSDNLTKTIALGVRIATRAKTETSLKWNIIAMKWDSWAISWLECLSGLFLLAWASEVRQATLYNPCKFVYWNS